MGSAWQWLTFSDMKTIKAYSIDMAKHARHSDVQRPMGQI